MDCFRGEMKSKKQIRGLRGKVRILEEEIKEMMSEREKESRGYESFAVKEAEWKQQKKKLKEEVKRLRKLLEEKEEKNCPFSSNDSNMVVEQIWRDEAVEKWKKLYLAIKSELDDLIDRTHPGDGLCCKAEEEEIIEQLKLEVKCKDKTIEELKAKLREVEQEEYKRAREVDILRQSLRIMTSRKAPNFPLTKLNIGLVKQPKKL